MLTIPMPAESSGLTHEVSAFARADIGWRHRFSLMAQCRAEAANSRVIGNPEAAQFPITVVKRRLLKLHGWPCPRWVLSRNATYRPLMVCYPPGWILYQNGRD